MIWRDKDDLIGLLLYGILWGIPLLLMIILTLRGDVSWGIIAFYEIPAIIGLLELKPWKKKEIPGIEQIQYIIRGTIPDSSRTFRFIMALIPGYNMILAWGTIEKWLKNGKF